MWNYSSGTTNIITRVMGDLIVGDPGATVALVELDRAQAARAGQVGQVPRGDRLAAGVVALPQPRRNR